VTSLTINENYLEEKERFIRRSSALSPLSFAVKNTSSTVAEDVRIEINIRAAERIIVCDLSDYPEVPSYYKTPFIPALPHVGPGPDVTVTKYEDHFHLVAHVPKVQPGTFYWCYSPFFIGAEVDTQLTLEALAWIPMLTY